MSLSSSIFIGCAEFGYFLIEIFVRLYLLKFYTDTVKLEPFLASLAISICIFWDAISDPIMGYISDYFPIKVKIFSKNYVKKRVFYILAGSFFSGITLSFLFTNWIETENQLIKFFYLLLLYFLLNTFLTITSVPHSALCGEATIDSKLRNRIFGFRLFWGNLGLITGIIIPNFFNIATDKDIIYRNFLLFILIFSSSIISFICGYKYDNTHSKDLHQNMETSLEKKSLFFVYFHLKEILKNFIQLLKNYYLVILLLSYVIAYIGIGINSAIALYYYEYFLKLNNWEISIILLIFLIIWTMSIPLWIVLSRKIGKKKCIIISTFSLGIFTIVSYPNFPEKNIYFPLIGSFLGGILVSCIVLLDILIADLVDYDYVKNKMKIKKEGLFFGFLKFSIKISRSLSILIAGLLLNFINFNPDYITPEVEKNISLIFGYVVGLFFVLSSIIFYLFDYTEDKHNKVIQILLKKSKKI